jgi:hypothetical protein
MFRNQPLNLVDFMIAKSIDPHELRPQVWRPDVPLYSVAADFQFSRQKMGTCPAPRDAAHRHSAMPQDSAFCILHFAFCILHSAVSLPLAPPIPASPQWPLPTLGVIRKLVLTWARPVTT